MQSDDFIKLLNCTARFINYGKHNVLSIFEWEQTHLYHQTGKQAVLLKSYKKWNEIENKIVSGKGIDLDIEGLEEKVRFFDISQTTEPKHKRNAKEKTDTISKEELTEIPSTTPKEIGFAHRHRALLLTAMWKELSIKQAEYEKSCDFHSTELQDNTNENMLSHISVFYIIHSYFKSNWQNSNEVEAVFDLFYSNFSENNTSAKTYLLGHFFSQVFQSAINLIVRIERRFDTMAEDSDNESDNYYQKIRFYDICRKEKIAVCRLKPDTKVDLGLSLDSYDIIETLPYKPNMEREAFLEYLQSIFNNALTEEHIVLVRKKNINGVTIVTAYRIDVKNWGVKQKYIDFNIVFDYYPISFYLRQVSTEYLDNEENNVDENIAPTKQEPPPLPRNQPHKQVTAQAEPKHEPPSPATVINTNTVKPQKLEAANSPEVTGISETVAQKKSEPTKKKQAKKKRTDVLHKVNKLKEDMQNKSC